MLSINTNFVEVMLYICYVTLEKINQQTLQPICMRPVGSKIKQATNMTSANAIQGSLILHVWTKRNKSRYITIYKELFIKKAQDISQITNLRQISFSFKG